jgi:hypothetical protein
VTRDAPTGGRNHVVKTKRQKLKSKETVTTQPWMSQEIRDVKRKADETSPCDEIHEVRDRGQRLNDKLRRLRTMTMKFRTGQEERKVSGRVDQTSPSDERHNNCKRLEEIWHDKDSTTETKIKSNLLLFWACCCAATYASCEAAM